MYNVTIRHAHPTLLQWKTDSITYSERMSVTLGIQHALRVKHTVICGLAVSIMFTYYPTMVQFSNMLLNIKCVLWFSLQLLSETLLILERNGRDMMSKTYNHLHIKLPLFLSDLNETRSSLIPLQKVLKCQILWKFAQWEPSCSMLTDRHGKVKSCFTHSFIHALTLRILRCSNTGYNKGY